jgi:opacity protein-like surface antigen
MHRGIACAALAAALALALPAAAQTAGPVAPPPPPAELQIGFDYGFAVFTESHADAAWFDGAPAGRDMDLETSPSVGLNALWRPGGGELAFGAAATAQKTRLLLTDGDTTSRTDMTLLHLQLAAALDLGAAALRPVVEIRGGAMAARGEDAGVSTWHYSASAAVGVRYLASERVSLRLLARVPVIWAGGELVAQFETAGGAALHF